MSIDISTKTEARLLAKAQEQGRSVEALIEQLLGEAPEATHKGKALDIPRWDLGAAGSLHRNDLYEDAG